MVEHLLVLGQLELELEQIPLELLPVLEIERYPKTLILEALIANLEIEQLL